MAVFISTLIVCVVVYGSFLYVLWNQSATGRRAQNKLISDIKKAEQEREELLKELAELSLSFITEKDFKNIQEEVLAKEDELRAEEGRISITQAEVEAMEIRQRELDEVDRELESSALEVNKELEMLRSQEEDIANRTRELQAELAGSLSQLDMLIEQLASSQEVADRLNAAKTELLEGQKKIEWYREEIANINSKYMQLKQAYDALDIEYAQLYEKQSLE